MGDGHGIAKLERLPHGASRRKDRALGLCQRRHKKGPACAGPPIITIDESNLPAVATTAAATTAAVTATEAATAARTPTTPTGAWLVLSLVDAQLTTTHVVAVQALDRPGRIGLAHLDEPESAGAACLAIGRQRHGLDSSMLREQLANIRLASAERQIAYIDFGHKFSTLSKQLEAACRDE